MGLFNNDRLAGQFKLLMDLSLDLEPPLTWPTQISDGAHWASPPATVNSLSHQSNADPPTNPSALLHCLCEFMALACLVVLWKVFFNGFILDARSVQTRRDEREFPGWGAPFALRSKLRMPGRKFFEHRLTGNSIRMGPSQVCHPNTSSNYGNVCSL
jgi:hypothetical protein